MNRESIPDPLGHLLYHYCQVEAPEGIEALRDDLRQPQWRERTALFRQQLADAIVNKTITPEQYERLTGLDFDTPEDFNKWLRCLWKELFGDDPISAV